MIEIEKLKVGDTVWVDGGNVVWEGIKTVIPNQVVKITAKTVRTEKQWMGHPYQNTYQSCGFRQLFYTEREALAHIADVLQDNIILVHVSLEDLKKKLVAIDDRAKEIDTA